MLAGPKHTPKGIKNIVWVGGKNVTQYARMVDAVKRNAGKSMQLLRGIYCSSSVFNQTSSSAITK